VLRLWDVPYSFGPNDAEDRIEAWCSTANPTAENGWGCGELEEHVRDEHSTFSWLLEPMVQRSGFTIEDVEYTDDGISALVERRCPRSRRRCRATMTCATR
jgi:hypothetical protein